MSKQYRPLAVLFIGMLLLAAALFYFEKEVHWGGFVSMMVFYGVIFYLGIYASKIRKSDNITEVMLAGRSIPLFVAVFTMSATWVGGGYINGTAEYTASWGLTWVQAPWGYALSLIVGGLFFARKMRRYEFKTMLDPLEQRFGKKMAALLFLPALTGEIFWSAAILTALGTTFGTVLGLDFNTSIVLSALIAIAYTALGGLWAVALTDIVQLILLFVGLILVIPFALEHVGGWENAWQLYTDKKGHLSDLFPPIDGWRDPNWGNKYWNWLDYALLLIFGGVAWQVYFQRVLSAKNENTAMWLSIIAGFVCMAAAVPAVMIGVIGDVVDWSSVGVAAPENASLTLPYVARYLTNPWVSTLALGAIAAAVMSSVDSSILSASSMASWNIYRPLVNPDVSPEKLAIILKRCIWIIGIASTLLALQVKSVYALWFLCSDFVYCILFPQLVAALFDKKANYYGSLVGFIVSFVLRFGGGEATLGIPQLLPYPMVEDGVVLFPFRTLAMVSGLVSIFIISRLTQKQSPPKALVKPMSNGAK
ncbi:MAG: sodium:solute symporter family protein [Chitinophagales bacterium]